jgi:hypothetical protein
MTVLSGLAEKRASINGWLAAYKSLAVVSMLTGTPDLREA